jgi:hypothetical protein
VVEDETVKDMLDRYNIAMDDSQGKLKLLYTLSAEYIDMKVEVYGFITEASNTAKNLELIALGKSFLTSVDYIKRLIESERRSSRPNKEARYTIFTTGFFFDKLVIYAVLLPVGLISFSTFWKGLKFFSKQEVAPERSFRT